MSVGTPINQFEVFPSGNTTSSLALSSLTIVSPTEIDLTLAATPGDGQAIDLWYRRPPDTAAVVASGIYDNAVDGDGLIVGRQLQLAAAAITVAAPVSGGVPAYPTIASAMPVAIFDARQGATLASGKVTALADRIAGYVLVAPSGAEPTFAASSQNGLPGLVFAGSQGMASASGATWMAGTSPGLQGDMTGLLVFKPSDTSLGVPLVLGQVGGGVANGLFVIEGLDGTKNLLEVSRYGSAQNKADFLGEAAGTLYKVTFRYAAASSTLDVWVNGGARITSTLADAGVPGASWSTVTLGQYTQAGFGFSGAIYEVELFNGAASDADIATLQGYAASKWGS